MAQRKGLIGAMNDTLFHNPTAFATIIGMQFMATFIATVFDPFMQWLLPDRIFSRFDILLPDNDPENDAITKIQVVSFLRKVIMLIVVIFIYNHIV